MSERRDGDRIVVTGYSAGSHFPRTQAMLQYRFEADGLSREGPFHIDGSVYGRDLRLRGPGAVVGPVLGRGDITLENHGDRPQRLLGGLHASGNVVAVSRGAGLERSLVASLDAVDYVVRGDVIAEHVSLENAVVFGNVRGRQVRLTHCVVFGQVIATEAAVVAASTFVSCHVAAVTFEGPCVALFAMGASEKAPAFAPYRDAANKVWESDLRFYPVYRGEGSGALTNRCWEAQTPRYAAAKLHPSDWVRTDAERVVRRHQGGKVVEQRVPAERYVFTAAGRALNFRPVEEQVERLAKMLRAALEFGHYHPATQQKIRASWGEQFTPDERRALHLATDPVTAAAPAASPPPRAAAKPPAPPPAARPAPAPVPASTTAAVPPQRAAAPPPAPPASSPPPSPPAAPARAASAQPPPASAQPPASLPLLRTTKALRGDTGQASPSAAPPRPSAPPPADAPRQVLVYRTDGQTVRGTAGAFDPASGRLALTADDGAPGVVALDDVLVILFGLRRGQQTPPPAGPRIAVTLADGRQLTGSSPDHATGAAAFTLLPDDGRGNIESIWIPRRAVTAVHAG